MDVRPFFEKKQAMARDNMPFLSELAQKGMTFEYSYSSGRKSIDGMPSVLSSIPSFVEPFFLTPASMNDLSGIAGELSRNKGYTSAFFHGAENGSMGFQAFAKATGFQEYYGRTEYNQDPRYHGDDDFDGTARTPPSSSACPAPARPPCPPTRSAC